MRAFAVADLHATAAFLGSVTETVAVEAWTLVQRRSWRAVDVHLREIRLLGRREPSAVSAIVDDGADALISMMRSHRDALVQAGLMRPDDRDPLPHVTVARIQRSASPEQRTAAVAWTRRLEVNSSARLDRLALYTWSEDRSRTLFRIHAESPSE